MRIALLRNGIIEKRNMMKDFEFVGRLVKGNQYLTTEEEKAWCRSALFGALNWGYRIDREQEIYIKAQKSKNVAQWT